MTKHTPGPWMPYFLDGNVHIRSAKNGRLIALVPSLDDARLIRTAPVLLEAAMKVVELRDKDMSEHDRVMFLDEGINMLRGAIIDATGSAE